MEPASVELREPASGHPPPRAGRGRWVELAVLAALLAGAVAAAALWSRARSPLPRADAREFEVTRPSASTPAPDFVLPDLEGRPVRLRDFRGQVVLLNFWATWCAPCRKELPAIETLSRTLAERGLVVLAVNYQEALDPIRAFVREYGLSVPVLLDRDGAVTRQYRVRGLPATVLVDRTGAIAGSALGYRDWDAPTARAYLAKLLAPRL